MKLPLPRHPFLRGFALVVIAACLLQLATALLYLRAPQLFYYRAWEYFFMWANITRDDDSHWHRREYSDLGHRYFFKYQESRVTEASTDRDGYRSVPGAPGPSRIFVQGRSNVFGSGVSDRDTFASQLAQQSGTGVFNGGNGQLLSTLSRADLADVALVIDVYHERHLATQALAQRMYGLKQTQLQPYKPIASQHLPAYKAMQRGLIIPGWWLPDIVQRQWRRLRQDIKEQYNSGSRDYLAVPYRSDGSPLEDIVTLMQHRRGVLEGLGYRYLAVILPSKLTVFSPPGFHRDTLERGPALAAMLEDGGFPLVNLYPAFLTDAGADLYFAYDTHWNARGQKLAAALTLEQIRTRYPDLLQSAQLAAD
ncbi:MAG: hypothetical protein V2J89_02345 [Halieaceae bacterium]|nr:hypothetical protein [Halieaceae bacterium]